MRGINVLHIGIKNWPFDSSFSDNELNGIRGGGMNKYCNILLNNLPPNINTHIITQRLGNQEKEEESKPVYKRLKNKHSAIENINELEYRGLNHCPNRSYRTFKNYVGLPCTAYNLHKIGRALQTEKRNKLFKELLKQSV